MNQVIKKKWVKALRSGKYKQGSINLRNTKGGYCCLGVLAEIIQGADADYLFYPPEKMIPDESQMALASVNDLGVPFEMIAGLIDEAL
jgi:hypothetical protein